MSNRIIFDKLIFTPKTHKTPLRESMVFLMEFKQQVHNQPMRYIEVNLQFPVTKELKYVAKKQRMLEAYTLLVSEMDPPTKVKVVIIVLLVGFVDAHIFFFRMLDDYEKIYRFWQSTMDLVSKKDKEIIQDFITFFSASS